MSEAPDGMYIVKDGVTYQVTPRFAEHFPLAKKINLSTGEIIYPTNADRIRSMTDEELAEWLFRQAMRTKLTSAEFEKPVVDAWIKWLKTPVEVDE